jgi:acyl-coenzyme A synthetase/AMP-(fatty) acid ligase
LHHAFAFLGHLVPGLVHGLTTHLYTDFSAFLKSGHLRSGAGLLAGVPSHFEAIVRTTLAPQTQLTQIVSAGGHLSPDLRLKLSRIFPQAIISTNYGQTEASPRILSLKSTNLEFFKGSDGFPVGQWQLRIGGTGELQVKGPQVMLGYTDQPQTSEWLSTGDLAELSSDGHFKILGRNDNLIKLGGERVSLPTLETNYKANLGTTELILLTQADLLRGTILHLVLKESDMTNSQALSTLSNWFRKSHLPCKIVRLKEIPYLANGKPDRKFLQDLVTK